MQDRKWPIILCCRACLLACQPAYCRSPRKWALEANTLRRRQPAACIITASRYSTYETTINRSVRSLCRISSASVLTGYQLPRSASYLSGTSRNKNTAFFGSVIPLITFLCLCACCSHGRFPRVTGARKTPFRTWPQSVCLSLETIGPSCPFFLPLLSLLSQQLLVNGKGEGRRPSLPRDGVAPKAISKNKCTFLISAPAPRQKNRACV